MYRCIYSIATCSKKEKILRSPILLDVYKRQRINSLKKIPGMGEVKAITILSALELSLIHI